MRKIDKFKMKTQLRLAILDYRRETWKKVTQKEFFERFGIGETRWYKRLDEGVMTENHLMKLKIAGVDYEKALLD